MALKSVTNWMYCCDKCGDTTAYFEHKNLRYMERYLREKGWQIVSNADLCDKCKQELDCRQEEHDG